MHYVLSLQKSILAKRNGTSVFAPHALKQAVVCSDISLIIITASITSPIFLWFSVRHAVPLPTLRFSLTRGSKLNKTQYVKPQPINSIWHNTTVSHTENLNCKTLHQDFESSRHERLKRHRSHLPYYLRNRWNLRGKKKDNRKEIAFLWFSINQLWTYIFRQHEWHSLLNTFPCFKT